MKFADLEKLRLRGAGRAVDWGLAVFQSVVNFSIVIKFQCIMSVYWVAMHMHLCYTCNMGPGHLPFNVCMFVLLFYFSWNLLLSSAVIYGIFYRMTASYYILTYMTQGIHTCNMCTLQKYFDTVVTEVS